MSFYWGVCEKARDKRYIASMYSDVLMQMKCTGTEKSVEMPEYFTSELKSVRDKN